MLKNLKRQEFRRANVDYGSYMLSGREWIIYSAEAILILAAIGYFFYRSVWASLVL